MGLFKKIQELFSDKQTKEQVANNDIDNGKRKQQPKPSARVVDTSNQGFVITTSDDGETNIVTLIDKPLQHETPAPKVVEKTQFHPKGKWPAKAYFLPEPKKCDTFGVRYEAYCASLPTYRFFEDEPELPTEAPFELREFLGSIANSKLEIDQFEKDKDYDAEAQGLELIIRHEYWQPWPYTKLMSIYKEAGLLEESEQLRQYSIMFFTKRREKMAQQIRKIAEQQDVVELVEQMIAEGKRISYYQGLYVMYDPYPCIEEWKAMSDLSK